MNWNRKNRIQEPAAFFYLTSKHSAAHKYRVSGEHMYYSAPAPNLRFPASISHSASWAPEGIAPELWPHFTHILLQLYSYLTLTLLTFNCSWLQISFLAAVSILCRSHGVGDLLWAPLGVTGSQGLEQGNTDLCGVFVTSEKNFSHESMFKSGTAFTFI